MVNLMVDVGRTLKLRQAINGSVSLISRLPVRLRFPVSTQADAVATCGSTFYTSVEQVDARGGVTLERRGSSTGPTITRSFNALNGQLTGVCTGPSCIVQNAFYAYDNMGQRTGSNRFNRLA